MGDDVGRLEHSLRLQRLFLVRARRILGIGRLHGGARAHPFRSLAMAHHPGGRDRRRVGRRLDRVSNLPFARPLFRAGDARLPARDTLRLPVARLSGNPAADEAGGANPLHAVRRPARLCGAGTGPACDLLADLAQGREFAFRHVIVRDQAERAGGRGRWYRHVALENAGADAERRAGGGGGCALRCGVAGGDPRKPCSACWSRRRR
jgi:hypothetical protein